MMISAPQSLHVASDPDGKAMALADRLQWLVESAARLHLFRATCLVKAIALFRILGKRNIPARVRIGARRMGASVFAHAWVEVDQRPVGEADDIAQRFPILEFSAGPGGQVFI
jgi:hypothetical protein